MVFSLLFFVEMLIYYPFFSIKWSVSNYTKSENSIKGVKDFIYRKSKFGTKSNYNLLSTLLSYVTNNSTFLKL